nr:GDSL esterase/lipase LIP-4-like isoform X1 [Ipomoea batatas]
MVVFFLCAPPFSGAQCVKNPVIFNFGDSNSDTGGYAAVYGNSYSAPNGRSYFGEDSTRMCDGRLIIDFLCVSLKADYLSSYLECLESNFTNGVNFAVVGSKTVSTNPLFTLSTQVDFAGALYTIGIGQNDLSGAFTENKLSVPEVMANIPSFISEIKTAIEMGCLIHLNEVANEFNTRLGKLCELMRSELNESVIVYVDMYTIKYNVISNYALYGFESPLMTCCGGGGPPYNANVWCGLKGSNLCEKEKRYIS